METKNKSEYIKAWESHIDTLHMLALTPSAKLSKEVQATIRKLKRLVAKVAEDKKLKR